MTRLWNPTGCKAITPSSVSAGRPPAPDLSQAAEPLASAIQRIVDECPIMRLNCVNTLKVPGLS